MSKHDKAYIERFQPKGKPPRSSKAEQAPYKGEVPGSSPGGAILNELQMIIRLLKEIEYFMRTKP